MTRPEIDMMSAGVEVLVVLKGAIIKAMLFYASLRTSFDVLTVRNHIPYLRGLEMPRVAITS